MSDFIMQASVFTIKIGINQTMLIKGYTYIYRSNISYKFQLIISNLVKKDIDNIV